MDEHKLTGSIRVINSYSGNGMITEINLRDISDTLDCDPVLLRDVIHYLTRTGQLPTDTAGEPPTDFIIRVNNNAANQDMQLVNGARIAIMPLKLSGAAV